MKNPLHLHLSSQFLSNNVTEPFNKSSDIPVDILLKGFVHLFKINWEKVYARSYPCSPQRDAFAVSVLAGLALGGRACVCCWSRRLTASGRPLALLSQLELLEDLRSGEDERVDDAGYSEGSSDDGADRGDEGVEGLPDLAVLHGEGRQIVAEPQRRHHAAPVSERHVFPEGIGVLVRHSTGARAVLVYAGHDLHHVVVRLQAVSIQLLAVKHWVEGSRHLRVVDVFAEAKLMDDVCEVGVVWLRLRRVRRHVEVAGDLVDEEAGLEQAPLGAHRQLLGVVDKAHLVPPLVVLDVQAHIVALQFGQRELDEHWDPLGLVAWVVYKQLGGYLAVEEVEQLRGEESEHEQHTRHADHRPGDGGLSQVFGHLAVDVQPSHIKIKQHDCG